MLTPAETAEFFDAHNDRSAFRLEVLDSYSVGADGGDVARYLAGEPDPDPDRKQPWLEELRQERAAGKLRHRVHVLTTPLSDYLRYECEWGYLPNAEAGEEIHILDLTDQPAPASLIDEDFWLLDEQWPLRMIYENGKIQGTILDEDPAPYLHCRDEAIAASVDFRTWWDKHPEYWRVNYRG